MAVVHLCGFEGGSTVNGDMIPTSAGFNGSVSLSTTTVRSGVYALHVAPSAAATGWSVMRGLTGIGITGGVFNKANLYTRFYFRYVTKPAATSEQIAECRDTAQQTKSELRINSAGNLVLYSSALGVLATGTTVLAANTWYRIEWRCGTGASGNYEVRIVDCGPTGADTAGAGSTEFSGTGAVGTVNGGEILLGKHTNRNSNAVDYFYDDVIIDDAGFPGAGKIVRLAPNANGTPMQWASGTGVSNYTQIDEVPRSLTDWVQSSAIDQSAMFGFEAGTISGTVKAVVLSTVASEVSEGTSNVAISIASGGSSSTSGFTDFGSTSNNGLMRITEVDPFTSSAWTTAAVAALEAGLIEGSSGAVRMRLYWASIFVDYNPEVGTGSTATGQTGTLGSSTFDANVPAKQAQSLALYDEAGNLLANTTGFYWAWIERSRPALNDTVVDAGGPVSTDSSGIIIATLDNSTLNVGATGYLLITQTDGNPAQSPGPRAWQMPVIVTTGA